MYSDIEENRNKSNHITLCQFRWDEMRGGVMGSDQIRSDEVISIKLKLKMKMKLV